MDTKGQASSFFTGFLIGGLIGAATALILAPQSGEETRTQIREKSIEIKEKAETTYGEVVEKIDASTAELRGRTEELSTKLDQLIAQGKQEITRLSKRGAQAVPAVDATEEAPAEA